MAARSGVCYTTSGDAQERRVHIETARETGKGNKKIKSKASNPERSTTSKSRCAEEFVF
jgi:CRISPR/Cas system Type II protein with McrA/HNH and RuvC-like nuclease domain